MEPCAKENVLERIQNDIKELFTRITELEKTSGRFDEKLDNIKTSLEKLIIKVDVLANMPSKRWDTIVTVGLTALVSGTIGVVLSKLF